MAEVLGGEVVAPRVAPSSRAVVGLRLLLAVVFVIGWAHQAAQPRERPIGDLIDALEAGGVTSVVMERPPAAAADTQSRLRVNWSGPAGHGYTYYDDSNITYYDLDDSLDAVPYEDDGEHILQAINASPSPVALETSAGYIGPEGFQWSYGGLASLAALGLLIFGARPRLATKWAWFWVTWAIPPLWLAFLLLEPVPAWRREPAPRPERPLTGGWAILLGWLSAGVLGGLLPQVMGIFRG